ncbi:hypothetical protein [Arthrobacter psychrolactophilus]
MIGLERGIHGDPQGGRGTLTQGIIGCHSGEGIQGDQCRHAVVRGRGRSQIGGVRSGGQGCLGGFDSLGHNGRGAAGTVGRVLEHGGGIGIGDSVRLKHVLTGAHLAREFQARNVLDTRQGPGRGKLSL